VQGILLAGLFWILHINYSKKESILCIIIAKYNIENGNFPIIISIIVGTKELNDIYFHKIYIISRAIEDYESVKKAFLLTKS